jgi:hypothetical protein
MRHVFLPVATVGFLFFGTTSAFAQDPKPADPPAAAPAAATAEKPKPAEEEDEFKHVTITANPLSLILTRIGLNVEYLPIKHHAIVLNPYFQVASAGTDDNKTSYTNFGAELGYHFYTGERGANGFFVGPSLLYMRSNVTDKATVAGQTAEASSNMDVYGAALDIGGQHVTKGGFTIGGGIGAMYLKASASGSANGQTSSTVKFDGVLPRFLLTVGYSF